jgi:cytochrome bd-type quinol oxidase subunit 1
MNDAYFSTASTSLLRFTTLFPQLTISLATLIVIQKILAIETGKRRLQQGWRMREDDRGL